MKAARRSLITSLFLIGVFAAAVFVGRATATSAYPIEARYAVQGPYATSSSAVTASSTATYNVFYPNDYSALGFKSPIVTWGNGTGVKTSSYTTLLKQLASWGFTVIATTLTKTGGGNEIVAAAQYLIGQSTTSGSAFYGNLDVTAVAAVGHSQGAGGAIRAAVNNPSLIKTLLLFSLPATKWVSTYCPKATDCTYNPAQITQPVFFITTRGRQDSMIASPSTEKKFFDSVPGAAALGVISKSAGKTADHTSIENTANGGNPDGFLGYATAWLLYQLRGDATARGAFTGTDPELLTNSNWSGSAVKKLV